jgi:hypothetical protein
MRFREQDEKKLLVEFVEWLIERHADDSTLLAKDSLIAEFLETRKIK